MAYYFSKTYPCLWKTFLKHIRVYFFSSSNNTHSKFELYPTTHPWGPVPMGPVEYLKSRYRLIFLRRVKEYQFFIIFAQKSQKVIHKPQI